MTLFLYLFRYYYIFSLPANPSVYVVYETGIHTNGVHVLWHTLVGDVAQWIERRSLTGELSLIYAWFMVDTWPLCGLGVRYGLTNQANSASHLFGVRKWEVIHVITWITEVETIKRQTGTMRVVV